MQKLSYIFLILIFTGSLNAQEAEVRVVTNDSWPPGKNVPVTIEVKTGKEDGFARLYHRLPNGFTVENVASAGADFFWDNNQINYVWTGLPGNQIIRVRYLAKADDLLSGTFKISARLDYVIGGSDRVSVYSKTYIIQLDKNADIGIVDYLPADSVRVTPEEVITDPLNPGKETKEPGNERRDEVKRIPVLAVPEVDFRIQVSSSSNKFSQAELEDRLGVKLKHGVKALKTGSIYKYQSGSFNTYTLASVYLDELKRGGLSDAFIVAFNRDMQISIKEAEKLLEK